jgi:opacity protein-like surface antigen
MGVRTVRNIVCGCCVALFAVSTPARAQGFVSPLIGYNFGGTSGCPQISNCEDKRTNFGVAFGKMGPILGIEEEFADARNFFGKVGDQSSSVITVMTNVMVVPALGPVHPYLLFGLGLMKTHVEFTSSDVLSTTNNSLAWDTGGGVTILFTPHVGIRGDIRHFHSAKSFTIPFIGAPATAENLTFGRVAGALVFAF